MNQDRLRISLTIGVAKIETIITKDDKELVDVTVAWVAKRMNSFIESKEEQNENQ